MNPPVPVPRKRQNTPVSKTNPAEEVESEDTDAGIVLIEEGSGGME